MKTALTLTASLALTLGLCGCPKEKGPAEPASDRAKEVHGQEVPESTDATDATKGGGK